MGKKGTLSCFLTKFSEIQKCITLLCGEVIDVQGITEFLLLWDKFGQDPVGRTIRVDDPCLLFDDEVWFSPFSCGNQAGQA